MARGSQGSTLNVFLHYSPPCLALCRWNLMHHTGASLWTCYVVYNDLGLLIQLLLPLSAKITGRCHHSECTQCWGLDSSLCACQASTLPSELCPWRSTSLSQEGDFTWSDLEVGGECLYPPAEAQMGAALLCRPCQNCGPPAGLQALCFLSHLSS